MKLIHISGSPGIGKTTLGEKLLKQFENNIDNVIIKDTDEFIQDSTTSGKMLRALENDPDVNMAQYNIEWKRILTEEVKQFLAPYKKLNVVIVFVGIMDNFGGEGAEFYMDNADIKLFMILAPDRLLEQYYNRVVQSPAQHANYWRRVAEGELHISSSADIVRTTDVDREKHIKHGYVPIARDLTFERVKNEILKYITTQ